MMMRARTPPPMYISRFLLGFVWFPRFVPRSAGCTVIPARAGGRNLPRAFRPLCIGYRAGTTGTEEEDMPPRGVKKGSKRARQYEHVKESLLERGSSESRAEEIAARTVNKERARSGEATEPSRLSKSDISSGRRGGLRAHRRSPRGRTRDQLYEEARKRNIRGRSTMTKAELERALGGRSS